MEFDDDFDVRDLDTASMDFDTIRKAVLDVIRAVGEDPDREGLVNTPDRVSRMYAELLSGYSADPEKNHQRRVVQCRLRRNGAGTRYRVL